MVCQTFDQVFDGVVLESLSSLGPGWHDLPRIFRAVKLRSPFWPGSGTSCDGSFCMSGCRHELAVCRSLDRLVASGSAAFRRRTTFYNSPRLYSLAGTGA